MPVDAFALFSHLKTAHRVCGPEGARREREKERAEEGMGEGDRECITA